MKPAPALAAVFVLALLTVASPASAAPTTIGSFPTWVMVRTTDAGLTFTGRADFSAAAQFPGVTVETNSTTVKTPTGESAWLGDSTGFGQHFGSTRAQPYLYLSPATGGPSTTTLEFDAAPPAGWGHPQATPYYQLPQQHNVVMAQRVDMQRPLLVGGSYA